MKLADESPPFIPENPSTCKTVQNLFMDEASADVVFEVLGGQTLLKEAVVNFIVGNASEIHGNNALKDVHGDFLNDALAALAINKKKHQAICIYSVKFNVMSISEHRREAHENGLSVDGTREMLISALERHYDNSSEVDDDWDGENDSVVKEEDGMEDDVLDYDFSDDGMKIY